MLGLRSLLGLVLLAYRSSAEGMTCEGSCSNILNTDDDDGGRQAKYSTCVAACETAAADAAAAFGGVTDEPPCYQDMVECGLSVTPATVEDAEAMFVDLLGCMTLRYTSSSLGELCQEHVEDVGMEAILECVGVATGLCGVPALSADAKAALESPEGADVASLIPDQIVCMATNLPSIAQTSETCASLVESLIAIEQIVLAAAKAHGLLDDDDSGKDTSGKDDDDGGGASAQGNNLNSAEQVTVGAFVGLAAGVLVCAFLSTLGGVKVFNWSKDYIYGKGDPDEFGGMEMPSGGRHPRRGQQAVKARDFDLEDDDDV